MMHSNIRERYDSDILLQKKRYDCDGRRNTAGRCLQPAVMGSITAGWEPAVLGRATQLEEIKRQSKPAVMGQL